jgi:inhibitor of cysteine peptidase
MDRCRVRKFGMGTAILVLVAALIGVAAAGCGDGAGAAGGSLNLAAGDNGKTLTIKVGDTVKVVLTANATTGYSWAAALSEKDDALLEQLGEADYTPDSTDQAIVGSGGTATLSFKALAKGTAELVLTYAQQFDTAATPAETFKVTLTIE